MPTSEHRCKAGSAPLCEEIERLMDTINELAKKNEKGFNGRMIVFFNEEGRIIENAIEKHMPPELRDAMIDLYKEDNHYERLQIEMDGTINIGISSPGYKRASDIDISVSLEFVGSETAHEESYKDVQKYLQNDANTIELFIEKISGKTYDEIKKILIDANGYINPKNL